ARRAGDVAPAARDPADPGDAVARPQDLEAQLALAPASGARGLEGGPDPRGLRPAAGGDLRLLRERAARRGGASLALQGAPRGAGAGARPYTSAVRRGGVLARALLRGRARAFRRAELHSGAPRLGEADG